ncbi:AAA family ATPase [Kamptonema formosum]|uniref:AAA family ATPase n=1 Tax=Kamptonema formosum TaxID=331992 RepID=UPI000380B957|nr:ATP-binding protein [Oscillatoria sp. PCC 10802]
MASTPSPPLPVDIAEVLQLADDLVFAKTGKHLDYLQEAILRGTLQERTYSQIADEVYSSTSHVRNVGHELWKILSQGLGKNITKANFRYIFEKGKVYNFSPQTIGSDNLTINNLHICQEPPAKPTGTQQPQETPTQLHLDLGDAPEPFTFYGRTSELTTLQQWITEDRCRLIALLGISGIGKTALAIRLTEQIKTHFDYIIYRSLRFSPPPDATLTNLRKIFSDKDTPRTSETPLSQLLNHLRKYRCLILLDDVQMLFSSRQLAGQYKSGCEDYYHFFQLIGEVSHNSCVMLLSWEKPRDIAKQEKENNLVRSFVLEGLGVAGKEILSQQNLSNEASWQTLIDTYQGNPLWLKLTATMIQELCGGRVAEFLQYDTIILDESLQEQLDRHFQRLTEQEQKLMIQLANEPHPVALPQLCQTSPFSPAEVMNAMQSLVRRFLAGTQEREGATFFSLNPVLQQYVRNRYLS